MSEIKINTIKSPGSRASVRWRMFREIRSNFWRETVEHLRTGVWLVETRNGRAFPVRVESGPEFAYSQSMDERVVPLVFTKLCFDSDGQYTACEVSTYDPQVLLFRRVGDTLEISYNKHFRGGYGLAYYAGDYGESDHPDADDRLRLECRDRALREYLETHPDMKPVIFRPRKKRPGSCRVVSFEKI